MPQIFAVLIPSGFAEDGALDTRPRGDADSSTISVTQ
jgi:hypothetical protein